MGNGLAEDKGDSIQVKYTESNGEIVYVRCRSSSLTNGKVKQIKKYTAAMIEWIAVYDGTTDRCYYVSSSELGSGRDLLSLRLTPPKNCQQLGIRSASRAARRTKKHAPLAAARRGCCFHA